MTPFRLTAPCKDYLWGGTKLREYGKISDKDIIAESWELSCHPDGESIIADGDYAGRTLTAFLAEHPEALGTNCARFDRFPVLIKLIDAKDNLSVQVHPDDAYAGRVENGKIEDFFCDYPLFILISTEVKGYRQPAHAPTPEALAAVGDTFLVDYVRVFEKR